MESKLMTHILNDMNWNRPEMFHIKDGTPESKVVLDILGKPYNCKIAFSYFCIPGSSVIKELKESINNFDPTLKITIRRGPERSHRSFYHDYYIFIK